jgi:hypothetical protein
MIAQYRVILSLARICRIRDIGLRFHPVFDFCEHALAFEGFLGFVGARVAHPRTPESVCQDLEILERSPRHFQHDNRPPSWQTGSSP